MRVHHGHSAALGFVLALALQRHALTFALLIFASGLIVGRMWLRWKMVAYSVATWWDRRYSGVTRPTGRKR